jgi:hypothetical protein
MSNHFSMGAINKTTNKYEYPKIANKTNKYKCPSCEKDVIFRNGKIKQPHFAHHKSDNPCYYYDKPSETQIHKDAKLLMKSLLDNKKNISIHRSCNYCEQRHCGINFGIDYDIFNDDYNENTKAIIEYKFYFNNSNRSADIAFVENDKIKYIFEICYKNKTREENRPEPWVEINAEDLINKINSGEIIDDEGNITIECIRNYKCDECIEYEENENIRMKLYYEKLKQEKIEKERQEKERNEYLIKEQERKWRETIKQKEEEKIRIENEEKKKQLCKCGIMIVNICICENPKYELVKLSNNLFCINCSKWKCRCK